MKTTVRTALLAAAVALGVTGAFLPSVTRAQPAAAPAGKILVVNVFQAFDQCEENQAFKKQIQSRQAELQSAAEQRNAALKEQQQKLGLITLGTPDYEAAYKAFNQAYLNSQLEGQMAQAELDRTTKLHIKKLFGKIDAMVQSVAKEQGATLVLGDTRPTISDQQWNEAKTAELLQVLGSRTVLFVDSNADITTVVKLKLDADYQKAGTAPAK
ncbi:MAG: OmpH family outer membrane protein [Tepidisphaeraceae bacterium]